MTPKSQKPRQTRRMSRRDFLKRSAGLSVVLGGAGLLQACVVPQPTSQVAPAEAPTQAPKPAATEEPMAEATPMPEPGIKRGGRLRDILSTAMESLDPHTSSLGFATFFPLLYDSLLSYRLVDPETETFEIGPGLAESYEVIDPTTLEFKLRQDVKFHDGSDFNAALAKWNLDRAATHPESKVNETLSSVEEV